MARKSIRVHELIAAWERGGGYDDVLKRELHREGRRALKALADALGLSAGSYEIRSNLAGPACTGEVTLHGEAIYVQVDGNCMGPGFEVLYRRCKGRKDYCGEINHFAPARALADPVALAARIRPLLGQAVSAGRAA